jgi:hypothetical protein
MGSTNESQTVQSTLQNPSQKNVKTAKTSQKCRGKRRDAENGTCPLEKEDDKLVHVLLKSNETKEVRTANDDKFLHANGEMAHKEITSRKKNMELKNGGKIFRRVPKIAKSDYWLRHARPSVRIEQLGSHCTDFHKI